jgi:hypothetical protein
VERPQTSPEADDQMGQVVLPLWGHDLTLVTRNTKDFVLTGARLLDPWHAG